ncbi:aspartate 1-decarboxylase [Mesorhizobium sp. M1A.F.Ca.IN.020.06.1.1]|uniref:aspartate 1-decarboxylase n=1 Tax=unclassified Mesorhizobium TaxID=325217 RepID=UPI000FC9E2F7|nr:MULTISPECIES: aspartate 1-decarboxylase [unclassified Mesorhizobium]RUV81384.1 aspartate 1-decarboxylase [Mesorhizobium sp. M1A.F.Ca.IN.020.32.1.1]RUW06029.1 aspartate 1-decarboxylase [Mesorhizobium sp. M1A.F.Ca.IN.022.05.2.1]RUW18319.1 aspartate 1-decarboxylase [Mesorhizobium sp. M1A.F.Ca.IN.020.06.1.1]RWF84967.1 MAG: aspartate 1-decarboxylase [Mesorhizobium sp.]RWG07019.1 MAG: aspartate 1-decarboxylase [Mesorhizobium sp.]
MRKIVAGKLHGIHVTEANLDYHGSITLDPDHCEEAGILPMEFVEIWNKNSGARLSTYVILGERGSRCCILNGAAARTCQPGDQVIICNSVYVHEKEVTALKPRVLTFDKENRIVDRLSYSVEHDAVGGYSFSILDEANHALPVPALVGRS